MGEKCHHIHVGDSKQLKPIYMGHWLLQQIIIEIRKKQFWINISDWYLILVLLELNFLLSHSYKIPVILCGWGQIFENHINRYQNEEQNLKASNFFLTPRNIVYNVY